jgi:hypothetical protein
MSRNAFVNSGSLKFVQNISVDPRVSQADESSENGGKHGEPDPPASRTFGQVPSRLICSFS